MAKQRKSKARLEYERIRRNINQQLRRAEKAGLGVYADLPLTPKQRGQKGYAKEYQKATTELKKLQKWLKESITTERKTKKRNAAEKEVADQIIENFLTDISNYIESAQSNASGAKYIYDKVQALSSTYGNVKLAAALQSLNEQGTIITRAERYDIISAMNYIQSLARELNKQGIMSDEDYETFLDMPEDDEVVLDELYDEFMDIDSISDSMVPDLM